MLDTCTNQVIKINTISHVINLASYLINQDYNVILVLDIDDTVLSTQIGKKFVEKDICKLCDLVYTLNPSNLIFLTARDTSLLGFTRNKLNSSKLLHKNKYINYNVICSPYDIQGNPTKGQTLLKYFDKGLGANTLAKEKNNWIIFVDDLVEQIDSVNTHINKLCCQYTLFHYKYSFFNFVNIFSGN